LEKSHFLGFSKFITEVSFCTTFGVNFYKLSRFYRIRITTINAMPVTRFHHAVEGALFGSYSGTPGRALLGFRLASVNGEWRKFLYIPLVLKRDLLSVTAIASATASLCCGPVAYATVVVWYPTCDHQSSFVVCTFERI
jgi:hypothetical protein